MKTVAKTIVKTGTTQSKTTSVRKWGNGYGVLLPKAFVDALELASAEVSTVLQGSSIVLTKKTSKKKMTLKDMVKGMNSADPHKLVDWGRPRGKEIW